MTTVSSPLKRIGGKHALVQQILDAFPLAESYTTYCEPCCGAAWVFLAKPAGQHDEILNDLDDNLITFWQMMREHGQEMQAQLDELLYSRALYYEYYHSLFNGTPLEPLDRAVRWFYCLRSTGTGWLRKSPVGWNCMPKNAASFASALELFPLVQKRLCGVLIDNRDVLATIRRYDSPQTFFYIDPPYVGAEGYYEPSKKGFPHAELAELLQTIQGRAAVSYYPHPQIDQLYSGWRRISWQRHKWSQIQVATRFEDTATEMLLCNYSPPVSLWTDAQSTDAFQQEVIHV
jgi:DNA adenine methylase